MKYSQTTAQKARLTLNNPFPHRSLKKSLPKIHEKVIPTHCSQIKRLYQGEVNEIFMLDQWAYVPMKAHKRSEEHRTNTEGAETNYQKFASYSTPHFRSTSEVFLKKYLKRKQMKEKKEASNVTNYVGVGRKDNSQSHYLEGIIKFNNSRLQKYKTEGHSMEKDKRATIQQAKTYLNGEIAEFRSQKMELKEKLRIYETSIKSKRFQIKIADKRYKNILHNFENINRE